MTRPLTGRPVRVRPWLTVQPLMAGNDTMCRAGIGITVLVQPRYQTQPRDWSRNRRPGKGVG